VLQIEPVGALFRKLDKAPHVNRLAGKVPLYSVLTAQLGGMSLRASSRIPDRMPGTAAARLHALGISPARLQHRLFTLAAEDRAAILAKTLGIHARNRFSGRRPAKGTGPASQPPASGTRTGGLPDLSAFMKS
jgi:hypothetical protein